MSDTSVPSPAFTTRGFVAPTEPEILAGVQADMNAAFGGNLNPALETPQGQLASSFTAVIGDKNDQFLALANGVDPAFADGRMQDAIARIYFLTRNPAVPTTVNATCSGLAGTIIPAGSLATDTGGNRYVSTSAGTIGGGGTVVIPFACVTAGPIACPAGTLTSIYRAVSGWDSITNATDGTPGRDVESRADFEARRVASVAGNSVNQLISIRAAVLDVANVTDAYVTDNSTASPAAIGGVTIPAYGLYVAVVGGADADIAQAIWSKKPPGIPYYATGVTTVTVYDTSEGYTPPYPSYSVKFKRPTAVPVFIEVSITDSAQVPANAQDQIRNAVLNAFNGGDGGARARIGATLYASRYYAAIASLGTWASDVISIFIGAASNPTTTTLALNIDQNPTLIAANVTLVLV